MANCAGFIEPLNLECWFVNTFAGTPIIFSALAFIVISALAAKFKMPNVVFLVSIGLFVVLMSQFMQGIYLLVMVIAGLITFYSITKIVKN